jgi:hypothetical protein
MSSPQHSPISRRNVGFYGTYRRRKTSIYKIAAAGGGGCQRQSSTTNSTNPTNKEAMASQPDWCNSCDSWFRSSLGMVEGCLCKTKPNSGRMGHLGGGAAGRANGAKQTQFPPSQIPHHSTIPSFRRPNPMPIVQNKPTCGPGAPGLRIVDCGFRTRPTSRIERCESALAGDVATSRSRRAKQSQEAVVSSR